MPFGLDIKSLAVGILLAWFVIPWVQAKFVQVTTKSGS